MDNAEKILKLLEAVQGDIAGLKDNMAIVQSDIAGLKGNVADMQGDIQGLKQDVSQIRQSQARMEHQHGEKLAALFDGYQLLSRTLADHTVRLERIEAKVTDHDIKIEILDKNKANRRKAKA